MGGNQQVGGNQNRWWVIFPVLFLSAASTGYGAGVDDVLQPARASSNQAFDGEFYRGQNFDGHSNATGLLDAWPEQGPPVLWTRELGQGYSSFVGRGDRVFTQYQSLANQFVICLDAATGETIWEYRYAWSYQMAGLYPGPRATPTLGGGMLYFTSPSGVLACLDQADGSLVWQVDLIEQFDAKPVGFGYACSPVLVGQKVMVPVGGKGASVVAFDKDDGAVIWKAGTFDISYASLLPISRSGREIIVAYLKNDVVLFDLETGQILSRMALSSGYDEHSAWPIYSEPYLWLSAPFREGSRLLEVTESTPVRLDGVWNETWLSNDVSSSVLVDGYLYGFDIYDVQSKIHRPSRGQFRCIEFKTGKPQWENGSIAERRAVNPRHGTAAADSIGHASVLYADGKLILLNDTGELILLAANHERCIELARIQVLGGEICWTQPMLMDDGRLYLRNQSRAVCLFLGDPESRTVDLGQAISVADIPQSSYFDLASWVLRFEPEYAMDAPTPEWLVRWYFVMLAIGWLIAFPVAVVVSVAANRLFGGREQPKVRRALFRLLAILMGVVGTTLMSGWTQDFVFTWPLVLALAFEILVFQTETRRGSKGGRRMKRMSSGNGRESGSVWRGRLALVFFVGVCLAYFYLCRRLSLAFEWSFLLGFPAALPFLVGAKSVAKKTGFRAGLMEWALTGIAFTAFYWMGAGVIAWKY